METEHESVRTGSSDTGVSRGTREGGARGRERGRRRGRGRGTGRGRGRGRGRVTPVSSTESDIGKSLVIYETKCIQGFRQ